MLEVEPTSEHCQYFRMVMLYQSINIIKVHHTERC